MKNEDYKELFEQLDAAAAFFKIILKDSHTVKDAIVEDYNKQYEYITRILGGQYKNILHRSYFEIMPRHDLRWNYYFYQAAIERKHVHGELRNREGNYWVEFSGGPASGKNMCWMVFMNHTKYKDAAEKYETLSLIDELTNVKNRNAYEATVRRLKKQNKPLGVIAVDLNGLKEVNDGQGHWAGDKYIRQTAEYLCAFSGVDLPYRVGGDEFTLFLEDRSLRETKDILAKIRTSPGLSLSAGFSWGEDSSKVETLIRQADKDMYEEKRKYYQTHDRRHVE